MKRTTIIVILFILLGAVTFLFIHELLSPAPSIISNGPTEDYTASTSYATDTVSTGIVATSSSTSTSQTTTKNSDGPFSVISSDGSDTKATVSILRSPEEVLAQFKGFSGTYPDNARLYLSSDLQATNYIDLGPARFNYGVNLYGIPLDTDLSKYPYLGIYASSSSKLLYYAKID